MIAAAKRARQLVAGDEPLVAGAAGKKPLSTAVQELYEQKVQILGEDDDPWDAAEDNEETTEQEVTGE